MMMQQIRRVVRHLDPVARVALGVIGLLSVLAALGPWIVTTDPYAIDLDHALAPPGGYGLLGTDEMGRGMFGRLVMGLRLTLIIGLGAVALGGSVGMLLGLLAAFYPRADQWIMRGLDVVLSFPTALFGLAIVAVTGPGTWAILVSLAVSNVPLTARMMRATAGVEMACEYVEAARALGMTDFRLLWRHVLPNCASTLVVFITLRFGQVILMGSILSFIGLGTQPPTPELGTMVAEGRSLLFYAPFLSILPAVLIFIVVLACNLLGDSLRDVLDVRRS